MTATKTTKIAALVTAICLMLSSVMMLGKTYAWFTDEAKSGDNIITSGTLDVDLGYWDAEKNGYVSVDDKDAKPIFNYDKWEPGYTAVKQIRIANKGNLALKYTLTLTTTGEQPAEGEANLAKVIDVYLSESAITSRSQLETMEPVGTLADLMAEEDGAARGILLPAEGKGSADHNQNMPAEDAAIAVAGEQVYYVALQMQKTAGNEYQNKKIGDAISVELYADQYTWENDSFDHEYDENAGLPVALVKVLGVQPQLMYIIPDITQGFGGGSNVWVTPDIAFTFEAQDDAQSVAQSKYKDWLVDYFVSIDQPVEEGVTMFGAYGNWESGAWYGFKVPAGDYSEPVALLGTMTDGGVSNWTYEDIVTGVNAFNCGVENTNPVNKGKVMTVELRLMNPNNPEEYYVISEVKHTLEADEPTASVETPVVPVQTMYIIPDITQGFGGGVDMEIKPDAAFIFTADDDADSVAHSDYKDWLVDYYVSFDKPIVSNDNHVDPKNNPDDLANLKNNLILVGSYGNWEGGAWYGFKVPAGEYSTPVGLLGSMSTGGISNWTYEEIVTGVTVFNCGVYNGNDSNNGTVMTVELRVMNPQDPTDYIVAESIDYVLN